MSVRVLLIEDNPGDVVLARKLLGPQVSALAHVDSLANAVDWLAMYHSDVILLDLGLPDSAGVATIAAVREAAPETPIVVITVIDDPAMATRAMDSGAEAFLVKSELDGESLTRIIRNAIERRRAQQRIYSIVWSNAQAMAVLDREGQILFANPSTEQLFGRPAVELIGTMLGLPVVGEEIAELQVRRPSGEIIAAEMRLATTKWRGTEALVAAIKDISERKRAEVAERAHQESERRLHLLLEQLPVMTWSADGDLRVTGLSGQRLALWQHDGDVHGVPVSRGFTAGDGAAQLVAAHSDALQGMQTRCGVTYNGRTYDCVVRAGSHELTDQARVIGVAMDVTEQRQLQEQVKQGQKMEAVGRLAGSVAHDFNNLLTAIFSFGGLVLDELSPADPAYCDMQEVLDAAERSKRLVAQLLAFSRRGTIAPRVLNLNEQISELLKMLQRILGEGISLEPELARTVWPVRADPGAIEQVLVNLIVNARDAMPNGGQVRLATSNRTLRDDAVRGAGGAIRGGDYAVITVTDTGCGIEADVQRHIFEPFFTTKTTGEGTGLGLATCYGIVRQAEGAICVDSQPGQGTTFTVCLPRSHDVVDAVEARERQPVRGGNETVLVVEDEVQVRRLAVRVLSRLGYDVMSAANGADAIARHVGRRPIDLLLTDVVMPKLGGKELADCLVKFYPQMRVLFMSGYARDSLMRHMVGTGAFLLEKPFTADELGHMVRAVLDS